MRLVILAFLALMASAGASFAQEAQPATGVARPYLEIIEEEESTDNVTVFSQADPRWAWFRIGVGTVRQYGCMVMAIAMVAADHGIITDPLSMLRSFVMHGMFTRSGALYTSALGRVLPGFEIVLRTAVSAADLNRIEEQLARGYDVLLKLDRDLRRAGIQEHWVRVVRSVSGDLIIADPNGGRLGTLAAIYGTTSVIREMLVLGRS